jgi:hypothetical protein
MTIASTCRASRQLAREVRVTAQIAVRPPRLEGDGRALHPAVLAEARAERAEERLVGLPAPL